MSNSIQLAPIRPQQPLDIEDYGRPAHTRDQPVLSPFDVLQYVPIIPPPTPAPSPGPLGRSERQRSRDLSCMTLGYPIPPHDFPFRRQYLFEVLKSCTPAELLYISTSIAPRLKRDFLRSLPAELATHILGFIDDPRTLARIAQVSKYWNDLVHDEFVWKRMCIWYGFDDFPTDRTISPPSTSTSKGKSTRRNSVVSSVIDLAHDRETNYAKPSDAYDKPKLSTAYQHFKLSYMTSSSGFLAYSV